MRVLLRAVQRLGAPRHFRSFGGSAFLSKDDAQARIVDVLRRFPKIKDAENVSIDGKTHFGDNLGLDSLDQVELMMAIEEEFAIEIPDENLDKIYTVEDLVSFVTSNPMAQ
jgi:NADH dehydrogenase (ubiquinone) 1 alpha/beta subcomplex 1, acyl-carrier protein